MALQRNILQFGFKIIHKYAVLTKFKPYHA